MGDFGEEQGEQTRDSVVLGTLDSGVGFPHPGRSRPGMACRGTRRNPPPGGAHVYDRGQTCPARRSAEGRCRRDCGQEAMAPYEDYQRRWQTVMRSFCPTYPSPNTTSPGRLRPAGEITVRPPQANLAALQKDSGWRVQTDRGDVYRPGRCHRGGVKRPRPPEHCPLAPAY